MGWHIEAECHFIREKVEDKILEAQHVFSIIQLIDLWVFLDIGPLNHEYF